MLIVDERVKRTGLVTGVDKGQTKRPVTAFPLAGHYKSIYIPVSDSKNRM